MTDLIVVPQAGQWQRLKRLVLDSVSSPITKRVYNLGLDEFFAWYELEPRPGFTKATVSAWRVALEARGLGSVSINVRITAVRKLAVEAADNGLLAPELAAGITRVKGAKSKGVRVGNWLSVQQAQKLLNAPDVSTKKGLRESSDAGGPARLRAAPVRGGGAHAQAHPAAGWPLVYRRPRWQARAGAHDPGADLGEGRSRRLDSGGRVDRGPRAPAGSQCQAAGRHRGPDSVSVATVPILPTRKVI
jgi:hypothetical protein